MPSAFPMSSFTVVGKLKKSRLADPTQCNGFSSAAGTRRTRHLSLFWDSQASQSTLALSEAAEYFGPGNGLDGSAIELGNAAVHLGCPPGFGVLGTSVSRLSSSDPARAARASVGSASASFRISAGSRFIVVILPTRAVPTGHVDGRRRTVDP